ncbi:phosphoribosylformylglycinamidine (FGAM) synthase PurS component [Brassicibacter mesophilus]
MPIGYKVDEANSTELPYTVTEEGNVIEVYYVVDEEQTLKYTVNYYKDGELLETSEVMTVLVANPVVENVSYENMPIGYRVDEANSTELPYTVTEESSVIEVYYAVDEEQTLDYTVSYYKDGELLETSEVMTVLVANPVVENVSYANMPIGYKVDEEASTSLPYTVTEESSVIEVYYVVDQEQTLDYTVNYYKDGAVEPFATSSGEVLVANPVVESISYENMPIGYKVDEANSTELPYTVTEESSVIKVYYTSRTDISYTVNYLEKNTNRALAKQRIVKDQTFRAKITEKAINIAGYKKVAPASVTITLAVEGNKISFYYIKIEDKDDDDDDRDKDKDRDKDDDKEIEIIDEEIPLAVPELNRNDHYQYIKGYPDNTVKPEGLITREEVATVFYRLLTEEYRNNLKTNIHDFSDVAADRWSNMHIATLAKGEIIQGYTDGAFKPSNYITRAELATIASRFNNLSPFESDKFSDINGHWANEYINSAAEKGWVNGYDDGTFKPDQYITRAEFVTLVNNVLERSVSKGEILPEARKYPDLDESKWYYEAMQEALNSHYYNRLEDGSEDWTEIYYPKLDM